MSDIVQQFEEKFRVKALTVIEFDHWTWSIRPVHSTLGAGILSLNRACTSFGAISRDEAAELADVNREIESRLGKAFSPNKFNYVMLMMVDPHLHFHVIPRYESPRDFGGINWIDSGWPALPAMGEGAEYSDNLVLHEIVKVLKAQS